MKNLKFVFAVVLTMLNVAAFAGSSVEKVIVESDTNAVYKLHYNGNAKGLVKVQIKNDDNKVLFEEVIRNKANFTRPYNFEKLPSGRYFVVVKDDSGENIHEVVFAKPLTNDVYTYVRKLDNSRFMFALGNIKDQKDVKINLYNNDGGLLYESSEVITEDFAQIFNLKQVNSSYYRIEVLINNKVAKNLYF